MRYLIILAIFLTAIKAKCAVNELRIRQVDSANALLEITRTLPIPAGGANALLAWDGPTLRPRLYAVNSDFSWDTTAASVSLSSTVWNTINSKASTVYVDNALSTMATIANMESQLAAKEADLEAQINALEASSFSGNYIDLVGKPVLFGGSYADLSNKPSIPAAQVNSDWNSSSGVSQILNKPLLFSGAYGDLSGKPTLFSGSYLDLSNKPTTVSAFTNDSGFITSSALIWGNITGKPIFFSGAYADLTDKPTLFTGNYSDLAGKPALFSGSYVDLTNKPTLFNGVYSTLTGIPSTFAPSAHTQAFSTITSTPTTLSGYGITDGVTSATLTTGLAGKETLGAATSAQSFSIQRANHTGTQPASTITGLATVATTGSYNDLSDKPTNAVTLVGTVTVTETAVLALSAGVRKVTVTAPGAVVGGNYLLFPTAATPANYALADVVCVVNGQLQVSVTAPILALGASYSFTCRLVKLL